VNRRTGGTAARQTVASMAQKTKTEPVVSEANSVRRPIDDRQFEIEFLDAGVEAFVFTFG